MAQSKGITLPIVYKSDPKGLNQASGQLGGFVKKLGGLAVAAAGAFSVAAITNFAKKSVTAASDLSESINAINVSFGSASEAVLKLGEDAANSLGLSQTEFNNAAVRFSAFAQQVVGEGGNTADFIDDISTRAADFASVFNIEVSEAMQVFQSGLAGEAEPLKRFGINLLQAEVEAYALRSGLIEVGETMTEQEKVQARYGLLMESTAKTAGDFANTSDGLANSQRILSANFADMQAQVGQALLPAFAELSQAMVPIVQELTPILNETMTQLAPVLTQIAGIIPQLLQGFLPLVPIIGQMAEIFLSLVSALLPPFAALLQALIPIIGFVIEAINAFIVPLVEMLAPILTKLIELWTPIIEAILPILFVLLDALLEPLMRFIEALVPFYEVILPLLAEVIEAVVVPALEFFADWLEIYLPAALDFLESAGLAPFLQAFEIFAASIKNGTNGLEVTIALMINKVIENFEDVVRGAVKAAKSIATVLQFLPATALLARQILNLPDVAEGAFGRVEVPERIYEFPDIDVTGISDAGRRSRDLMDQFARAGITDAEAERLTNAQRQLAIILGRAPGMYESIRNIAISRHMPLLPSPITRAKGGLVVRGRTYAVGEMGPELFVPQSNGEIIPNHRLGGGGDTYNITVQTGVGDPVRIGEEIVSAVKRYERVSGPVFASA